MLDDSGDYQVCPKCKTTKYRNPNMKMMVNVCGHNLCESCVELLFVRGSGTCPDCGISLRRNDFKVQVFENSSMDREVDIRRRILRDFNRHEEDFATLAEFNDYLEMVEEIIFNQINKLDVDNTNQRIKEYREKYNQEIKLNRKRINRDRSELEDIVAQEALIREQNMDNDAKELRLDKETKTFNKELLFTDLMSSSDPNKILKNHTDKVQQENRSKLYSHAVSNIVNISSVHIDLKDEPYVYEFPKLELEGPTIPATDALDKYLYHVIKAEPYQKTAGFTEVLTCLRALQDGFNGLYYSTS